MLSRILLYAFSIIAIQALAAYANISIKINDPYFEPSGSNKTRIMHIENQSDSYSAVNIGVKKRSHNIDGEETKTDSDNFNVFPNQVLLKPRENRVITLNWQGPEHLDVEEAYRVMTEEVQVQGLHELNQSLDNNNGGEPGSQTKLQLSVRFVFVNSIYVKPRGAKAKINLISASKQYSEEKGDQLLLTLENQGKAHQLIKSISLEIEGLRGLYTVSEISRVNILPGEKRKLYLPWPSALDSDTVQAKIKKIQ